MPIEIDFGRELGAVAFPDDVTEDQAQQYVRDNYQAIRQGLLEQRRQELAAETEAEEKAKFQLGEYGAVETALNTLSELPRGALEGIGGGLKAFARVFESGAPDIEISPEEQRRLAAESPITAAGQAVQEFGRETYPGLPGVRETIPSQIMAGLGSTAAVLPAALVGGPAAPLTAGLAYGLQAGESALQEADATINRRIAEALANQEYDLAADLQDRREQMKSAAFITTAPIGALTEGMLGAAPRVAQRFVTGRIGGIGTRLAESLVPKSAKFQQKFLGVTGAERVRGATEALVTEGAQESLEQLGGNIAAGAVYDPERGWLDGVAQAGLIGAASGGIVGGLAGSRRNADLADAAVEAVGGNPANPLPRSSATVAGIEDTQQEGEAEITAEDVLRMTQEGMGQAEQEVVPAPPPAAPATQPAAGVVPAAPAAAPEAVIPPAAPTELEPDEQAELDSLIEKEAAGTLTEDDSITLSAYRARLGVVEAVAQPTPTPTPSAVQEQGADEGVLRREEPQPAIEVELPQVARGGRPAEGGGAEAEVTPAEVQAVKAEVVPETPAPAPAPAPATEYTPARINKLFQTLKARATAVGKGLYEIKKLAPGQRAVLRTRFGGLQETDQFLLREKSQVTGNPSDEGFILRDKQEATAGEAPRPAPAPAPVQPTLQYTDADFAAAPSREAAGNMAVTQVRTNPSLPPRPPQIFYTLEAVANRAAKRPYDPKNLTAELIKQAQDSGLLTAAKNPKLTADGQRSLADGQRQSQERKAAQANLSDALRERAVLAWDAANDPQSAAYRERIAAKPAPAPAVKPAPTPAPAPQADPNEKLAAFIEDVDGAITNLESPAKLRAMVKKAVAAGYITATDAAEIARVQKSMGSAEDTTDAFGEFAGYLSMELEKRRKAPAAAPSEPAGAAGIKELGALMQRRDEGYAKLISGRKQITMEILLQKTRNEVERMLRDGEITEDQFYQYAKEWNKTTRLGEKMPEGPSATTKPISTAPATEPAPAQTKEVDTPPLEKQATEPLAPKAQKQFLLAQIDQAIAEAPEEATSEKIVISVPGDGEFTLLNYKAALGRFKELAKQFPVGPLAGEPKMRTEAKQPLRLGTLNLKNALKSASEIAADPKVRPNNPTTAIFSDGNRIVSTDGKVMLQMDIDAGGTVTKPVTIDDAGKPVEFPTAYPNVDQVIPKTTTVVSPKINTERLFTVLTQANQAALDPDSRDPVRDANVLIVLNRDGSIGLFSQVAGKTSYSHNVRKGAKVQASYNIRLLTDLVQAMRRVGVSEFDLQVSDEKGRSLRSDPAVLTAPGVKALLMPVRLDNYDLPAGAAEPDTGRPDSIESALQKVIAATDPKGKSFEAITALSSVVIYQATKIALRIYQATKSWIAARDAGMDYIKSHVQLRNEPETSANFEEFIKGIPNQEIPAGTPELPQPPNPAERVESRGLFLGEIERDTDENWAAEARKWVDFYKGNLERAYQVAMTANIDNAFREYVFAELLQRSELEVARAKNDVDLLRALNLQERIANSEVKLGAATGKAMAARKLSQERYWWLQPVLVYRNLVRKRQADAIPFPGVVSQQVRKWLVQSGREAIDQVREAMKQADKVFAREFKKIKAVPGAPGEGPIEINWREILTKSIDSQGSVRQKMLQVILADPRLRNLSPAGIAEITNLLTNAWEKQRNRIFTSEFRKKVPLPTVSVDNREKLFRALPRILRYANIARALPGDVVTTDGPETFLLWEQAFRDAVAPEFGVAEINGATARKLTAMAQEAQKREGINRNEIIQQMFRLMQREGGVNFSDALRDYWYAAVLSGTRTQVDNALNILNGALNTAMFAAISGRDAGLIAYSALRGLDEGIRDFWPMLWRGELYRSVNFNPDQPGNALEGLGESRNLFAKGISQMKYVSRLIQALDHVTALMSDSAAKAYALRKELTPEAARALMIPTAKQVADARAQAISEGTRPDLVNKRTREILQSKFPTDVLLTSKEIREMVTFTEVPQGLLGSIYEGLNAASRRFPALKFVTGTNFVRFAVNYTNELLNYAAPIAAWRWYKSAPGPNDQPGGLQFSQSRRDLLLAKAAIGTALGAFAAALFLGDDDKEEDRNIDITGSFKSLDPNKRKQLLAEGRQPYSIRFGNTYVSYRQFGFGGLLGAIGELRDRQLFSPDKWNQESITDKMLDAAAAGLLIVKDSSAISGLTEFLGFANAYKYDTSEVIEKAVPRYVARLAGSLVPNILKEVDAWSDPSIFKAEGGNLGYEYFLQQVPYARREIGPGPILNVLGEPAVVERYPWSRWVKERREDVAWDTLGRLASRGVFMPTPAITVKVNENGTRRQLNRDEAYQYQIDVGRGYRKFIEQNSKRLLALPPEQASELIDKNADRIRRDAREKLQKSIR